MTSKHTVKVAFAKFWKGFNPEHNTFVRGLLKFCDVEISDTPELVFYSVFPGPMPPGQYVKVFYTGECARPPWGECDWAFSFDYDSHPRHYRFPNWVASMGNVEDLIKTPEKIADWTKNRTRFCNFIYSNPVAFREVFCRRLSRFKPVDAPGRRLRNMPPLGGHIDPLQSRYAQDWRLAKLDFLRAYRFTIAFENQSYPGYATEKIVQAMQAGSIPIYWGDPLIERDFNPRSFVNYHDYEAAVKSRLPAFLLHWPWLETLVEQWYVRPRTMSKVIQRVRDIENDPALYARILAEPWFHDNRPPPALDFSGLETRLREIVECSVYGRNK